MELRPWSPATAVDGMSAKQPPTARLPANENGRVAPAVPMVHRDYDQKRYLKLAMTDQRDTPVLPLSLLFSWIPGLSVLPEKL